MKDVKPVGDWEVKMKRYKIAEKRALSLFALKNKKIK
jgi:hypothetical protein